MREVERELLELRVRLERLERRVRQLAGEEPEVPPPTPGVLPDPRHLRGHGWGCPGPGRAARPLMRMRL